MSLLQENKNFLCKIVEKGKMIINTTIRRLYTVILVANQDSTAGIAGITNLIS
jgi:hypothetical protein